MNLSFGGIPLDGVIDFAAERAKRDNVRVMISNALPYKNSQGEEIHAARIIDQGRHIALSPQAYTSFRKMKQAPEQLNDHDYALLNRAFNQADIGMNLPLPIQG